MPGFLTAIVKAAASGIAVGSLFYAVFAVGGVVSSALSPAVGFAIGFGSAVAIALVEEDAK